MIRIENTWVGGYEGAVRGMRMPYESQEKSDSVRCSSCPELYTDRKLCVDRDDFGRCPLFRIGKNDMELAKKLIKAGSEHRKFLRMIHVQADVTAPRFWWQEARTYKYFMRLDPNGLEMNSSSTMHLITKRELTVDDFSFDKTIGKDTIDFIIESINCRIEACNKKGSDGFYIYSHDERERFFKEIKQILPESFMQKATVDTNYEALLGIYHQRHAHRLSEWCDFCEWCLHLPYFEEFIGAMK